jgi:hypothetical protein
MGTTPILLLPYPEMNDPANVPTDMRELAEAIEKVSGGPLPAPVGRYVNTMQTITATNPAALQSLNPTATLRNPHTTLFLLVNIRCSMWVDATPGTGYVSVKASGTSAYYDSGGIRFSDQYESGAAEGIATVAPGATLTALPQAYKAAGGTVTVNYVRTVLTPTGWLKTGAIS